MPFKIADDPETNYREMVRTAYNRCAIDYAGQRRTTPEAELNFGGTMYWSNFGPSTYEKFLTETGFQIEQEGVVGGGSKSVNAPEEVHPFFFAVKREGWSRYDKV